MVLTSLSSSIQHFCFSSVEKSYIASINKDLPALILNQFVEECFRNRVKKHRFLWRIIKASHANPSIAKAARNALYILKETGFRLSGRNFNGARIDGADLSNAILENCKFRRTQARNLNVTGACLTGAQFHRADIQGMSCGTSPYLEHWDDVRALCLTADDRFIYSKDANSLYKWSTNSCLCDVRVPFPSADQIVHLFISQDNRFLFLAEEKGRVTAFNLETLKIVEQSTMRLGEHESIERLVSLENQLCLVILQETRQADGGVQTWVKFKKINPNPPFFTDSPELAGQPLAFKILSKYLSFSPIDPLMAIGHADGDQFLIEFWTIPELDRVATWSRSTEVTGLQFSRDGQSLFEETLGFSTSQTSIQIGQPCSLFEKDIPMHINFFSTKPHAAYLNIKKDVCMRNVDTGQLVCQFSPNCLLEELRLSPAENLLIGITEKKKMVIWRIDQLPYAKKVDKLCYAIQFFGEKLRLLAKPTKVRNIDLQTGRRLGMEEIPFAAGSNLENNETYSLEIFSKDGAFLIRYCYRSRNDIDSFENLSFWNVADSSEFCSFPGKWRAFACSDNCRYVALMKEDRISLFHAPEKAEIGFLRFSQPLKDNEKVVLAISSGMTPFGYVAFSTQNQIDIWKYNEKGFELYDKMPLKRNSMSHVTFACHDTLLIIPVGRLLTVYNIRKKTFTVLDAPFYLPCETSFMEVARQEQIYAITPDSALLLTWTKEGAPSFSDPYVLSAGTRSPSFYRLQLWNLQKNSLANEIPIPYEPAALHLSRWTPCCSVESFSPDLIYL